MKTLSPCRPYPSPLPFSLALFNLALTCIELLLGQGALPLDIVTICIFFLPDEHIAKKALNMILVDLVRLWVD
ncbi:uncharacterized protein BKA78DRAFT_173997 [Phyllosticta capitalensis]|uniref:uncharacterized protein n=1 Tax=Phyllosticta capitalensis TaxID=121624 RepID=UPI00312D0C2E